MITNTGAKRLIFTIGFSFFISFSGARFLDFEYAIIYALIADLRLSSCAKPARRSRQLGSLIIGA